MKSFFHPEDITSGRFSEHAFGQVQIVAIIGVQQHGRLSTDRRAHSLDHHDIALRTLFQWQMARPTPYLDLERRMAAGNTFTGFISNQTGSLFIALKMQVVDIERRIVTRGAQRAVNRSASNRRG